MTKIGGFGYIQAFIFEGKITYVLLYFFNVAYESEMNGMNPKF